MKYSPAHQISPRFFLAGIITLILITGFSIYHLQVNAAVLLTKLVTPPITPPVTSPITPPNITPTPTPTPIPNTAPQWFPKSSLLPNARYGVEYSVKLQAVDQERDKVKAQVIGLPIGLKVHCAPTAPGTTTCQISGRPKVRGYFTLFALATDSHGATNIKIYSLRVN